MSWAVPDGLLRIAKPLIPWSKVRPQGGGTHDNRRCREVLTQVVGGAHEIVGAEPAAGRKSFSWKDYRDLIKTAHQQLGGPIVLVWDNLNTHLTAGMRRYIADRDWLTVFQLPPYATDRNRRGHLVRPTTHHRGQPCLRRPK